MIIKPREVPLLIHQLQALLRRTPPNHQKIPLIKENLAKRMAGFYGKSAMDYPLSFLPEKSLQKIKRKLKNQHTPPDISVLERYQISRDQLIKGVHCSKCGHLPINSCFLLMPFQSNRLHVYPSNPHFTFLDAPLTQRYDEKE